METLFVNLMGCIAAYLVAKSRERSAWWFLLGWIGFVIVLALPSLKKDPEAPSAETHVRCPDCKELVRHDARKCKHCGSGLVLTIEN